MPLWSLILIGLLSSYFIGSIPFAIVIGQGNYGVDVRKEGSGNTGATNVLRTLGWRAGLSVMVLDVAKGACGPLLMMALLQCSQTTPSALLSDLAIVSCALLTTIGHTVSPFLRFKGGKGVATTGGTVIALAPKVALCAVILFVLVVVITRYVSVGSMTAALSLPLWMLLLYPGQTVYVLYMLVAGLVVVFLHRENIRALIEHRERKFSVGHKERIQSE